MHLDRGEQHNEVRREILGSRNGTREHGTAIIFQDRNRINIAFAELVLQVADVDYVE